MVCLAVYGGDAIAGVVETQSEAEEPGGLRYRALLRKSEQAVSISVVSKPEGLVPRSLLTGRAAGVLLCGVP